MATSIEETIDLRQLCEELGDTVVLPSQSKPSADSLDARLVKIYPTGAGVGSRYPLGQTATVIGRTNECTVEIADPSVSRRHARVELGPGGRYVVIDLGSTNGTYVNDVQVRIRALTDGDYLRLGDFIFRFLAGGNIEANYHAEIHRLAVLDPLTGLNNRRSLDAFLDREVERARRHARPLAVVLADIDHFKAINDRYGHLAGDFTLKALASRMQALTRKDELVARYGGEEFAVVLPETTLEHAAEGAERLRRAVADRPFAFEGKTYPVTISAGVGFLSGDGPISAQELLRQADDRLYEAKRAGRNRVNPRPRSSE